MCEGRSFEEIDEMTLFDLRMISAYRKKHPKLELLVEGIAIGLGVMKPPVNQEAAIPDKINDPRETLRALFKGVKFQELGDVSHVI